MKIVTRGTDEGETIYGKKYFVWLARLLQDYDDIIHAEGGSDTVYAGGGNDEVYGGSGNDRIFGQDGNDQLYGEEARDIIYGGEGNDIIYGGDEGDDYLYGRALYTTGSSTVIDGGEGNDFIQGGLGRETLEGGEGNDEFRLSAGGDSHDGGTGNDTFRLYSDDVWTLDGRGFRFDGGEGRDTLDLRPLSDGIEFDLFNLENVEVVFLGSGNDVVRDQTAEYLNLGAGDDYVRAGEGFGSSLLGAAGIDTVSYSSSDRSVTIYTDERYAQNGYGGLAEGDVLRGFEKYTLSHHDDQIYGDDSGETMKLLYGDDIAFGYGGDDTIDGSGWGEKFMNGGSGKDILIAGNAADTFWFDIDAAFGHDTIEDFTANHGAWNGDTIVLDANGGYAGRTLINDVNGDAVITVLGRPDSSITVTGAAGQISVEDLRFEGQSWSYDFDIGLI